MKTQSAQFGENWSHVRDHSDRGVSEADNRELFHITKVEFQPPSKAHRKRLARPRPMVVKARPAPAPDRSTHLALNKTRQTALDIVAINSPNYANQKRHGTAKAFASHEARPVSHPFVTKPVPAPAPTMFSTKHSSVPAWRRNSRNREHLLALKRLTIKHVFTLDQLCDIFAMWGNYDVFCLEL